VTFQTPKTVEDMLSAIHKNEYLMPAIQREFVWGPRQVVRLVDSLMRGYPIGSFLLWQVEPDTAKDYTFYDFLTYYHERDNPYATKATVPSGQGTTAILDGQQRLTALNIAVYGSHAEKKKYAWWNSTNAFPKKRLFLNLAEKPSDEELGVKYDLRFLSDEEAQAQPGTPDKWFRVGEVLGLADSGPSMLKAITGRNLGDVDDAFQRLYDLHQALRVLKPMNHYLVTDQDANKVLEIFVRVNSGGTPLSYSDLLLSMATNQWQDLDAREEVRSLVQELNTGGTRQFEFSKDLVLKTALMIAGVDLRFQVSNFTQANMSKVEAAWPDIQKALIRAANLVHKFGFTERTLTANSVVIPVAYYLHARGLTDSYLDSTGDVHDRDVLQKWVTRSLIKRGIWGSGLDSTLGRIRDAIDKNEEPRFPVEAVEQEMATIGKSLMFEEIEIDELLSLKYAGQRTFAVLSVLYPGLDLSKTFHEDHVFPKSRFTSKRLAAVGVPPEKIPDYQASYNLLPNLQLLAGTANVEKQDKWPADWAMHAFADDTKRATYLEENDLTGLDLGIAEFLEYYEARKARMRERLIEALGVAPSQSDTLS
jgi:hypothetical protein